MKKIREAQAAGGSHAIHFIIRTQYPSGLPFPILLIPNSKSGADRFSMTYDDSGHMFPPLGVIAGFLHVCEGRCHRTTMIYTHTVASRTLHGDADETVPVGDSARYLKARGDSGASVQREVIAGASHTFATLAGVAQVVRRSAEWLGERLAEP